MARRSPVRDCRMFCINCRYPLFGLDRHRCPECGREFDPDDPQTYQPREVMFPVSAKALRITFIASGPIIFFLLPAVNRGNGKDILGPMMAWLFIWVTGCFLWVIVDWVLNRERSVRNANDAMKNR